MLVIKYLERRNNKWYSVKISSNGSIKDVPLIPRIFGSRHFGEDKTEFYESHVYSVIHKGVVYTYKELLVEKSLCDDPTLNDKKTVSCNICEKYFVVPKKALATCPDSRGWVCHECCDGKQCERCQ
jgi:hypothetical protein